MRNFKKFSLLLVFMGVSVIFFSCKDEDNPTSSSESDLYGTWKLTKVVLTSYGNIEIDPTTQGIAATFTLNSDKTFSVSENYTSGQIVTYNGTWSIADGKITMKSSDGETMEMPYTVSGSTLSVETTIEYSTYGTIPVKMVLTKQ
jgi:hypothetical protein